MITNYCYTPRFPPSQTLTSTSAGASLAALASESPHVEVVRYEHKNLKMTLKGVDHNASALAAGLIDCGLVPGDVVLSWLPSHFAGQVCVC